MSGVVGVFAIAGSRVPCEPQIAEMASCFSEKIDYQYALSDHRLRLEAFINPSLDQSTFQCPESGSFVWLHGNLQNSAQLLNRIGSAGAASLNPAELVLRLYQVKGLLSVPMLSGSFAAVIWDAVEHRLVLFRDQLGTKNLFFSQDGDNLWFSTSQESLGLLQKSTPNLRGLHSLLMTGSTPLGETLISKVEAVRPGEIFLADRGRFRRNRYWQFEYNEYIDNPSPTRVQQLLGGCVDRVLERSGKNQLSVIEPQMTTGILTHLCENQSRYSVRSCKLNTNANHSELPQEAFIALVKLWGQPFGCLDDFAWARAIAQGQSQSHVVLPAGEGMAFGLHPAFKAFRWQQRRQGSHQCRQLDPLWALRPLLNNYAQTKGYFTPFFIADLEQQALIFDCDLIPQWQSWTGMRQVQSGILHFHVHSLLSRFAQVALARSFSLELPFLSLDVLEMLLSIDPQVHCRGVVGGQLLRDAFRDSLQDGLASASNFRNFQTHFLDTHFLDPHGCRRSNRRVSQELCLQDQSPAMASVSHDSLSLVCVKILQQAQHQQSLPFAWTKVKALCDRLKLHPSTATAADFRSVLFLASYAVWSQTVLAI